MSGDLQGLPEGWAFPSFLEVFDIQGGTQPPKSEFLYEPTPGYVQLLQIRDFGERPVPTYIPDSGKLKKCVSDDVLIARYGASIGRILTGLDGAYNVAMAKVDIPDFINKRFVVYLLRSDFFQKPLMLVSRSAQNGFNKEDLSVFQQPLAPLAEQKVIADKLDALLAQVDMLKARLDAIPAILKRFRQSVLSAAVTGKLTEEWRGGLPHKWTMNSIGEVCVIQTGKTPLRSELKYWNRPDIPWLTSAVTGQAFCDHANEFISSTALTECGMKIFPVGSLLMAMYGEGKTRGQVTELKIAATCNQACAAIIVRKNLAINAFVKIVLQENYEETRKQAAGGAQPNLNLNKVREIPVRLPPLPEQTEIVRRVESLFAFADQIEARTQEATARVKHLTQSILAKAFRGELTEEWRKAHPELVSGQNSAEALLERIRAARAAAPETKGKRERKASSESDTSLAMAAEPEMVKKRGRPRKG